MVKAAEQHMRCIGPPSKMVMVEGSLDSKRGVTFTTSDPNIDAAQLRVNGRLNKPGRPLRIRSKQKLAPGAYNVTLQQGKKKVPLTLDIQPDEKIKVIPIQLEAEIKLGAKAAFSLLVINTGNIAVEIKTEHVFGVFDDNGMETAFANVYRSSATEPADMLGTLFNTMRDSHGGLVKLRIKKGAGSLAVDQQVLIEGDMQFDKQQIKAGHQYHGVWTLLNRNIPLSLKVQK